MLHLIRNNSPYTVIILFIFTLVVKMQALSNPGVPVVPEHHELFGAVVSILNILLGGSAFAYTLLGAVMLFGQAIYLNAVGIKHKLLLKPTYIIAYVYIALTSIMPGYTYFSEIMLVNWCMIAGVDFLCSMHHTSQPRTHIYNTAFVMSIAGILHFQAVGYLLVLFLALAMLRSFNPGEWMVGIVGYFTPLYLYAGILFLFDKEKAMLHWAEIGWSLPSHLTSPLFLIGTLVGLITLAVMGVYTLQSWLSKGSIYTRRLWTAIAVYFFLSIAGALFTDISEKSVWLLVMPSLSLVIAPALTVEKTKWFSNFAFIFSILLLVFCQLTVK